MGRPVVLTAVALLTGIFIMMAHPGFSQWQEAGGMLMGQKKTQEVRGVSVPYRMDRGTAYYSLRDLREKLDIGYVYNKKEGTISLRQGSLRVEMLRGAPILNRNGIYLPVIAYPIIRDDGVWIPLTAVEEGLGRSVVFHDGQAYIAQEENTVEAIGSRPLNRRSLSPQQMAEYLSFLDTPIRGARVSTQDSHLPGAPRPYRYGVHEGLDYYSDSSGRRIDRRTPVRAAADGVVVRADHQYREMSVTERNRLLSEAENNNGQTPQYILDKMRGRSVWVQHKKGVLTRYVHLSDVADHIHVGKRVKKGEMLGRVGNSGTRQGAQRSDEELHLHFDVLIYGEWFWNQYTMEERREILQHVFDR